jgi:hypothetical protein
VLLIREFAHLSGRAIDVRVGDPIPWSTMAPLEDRKTLLAFLYDAVFSLGADRPRAGMPAD